MSWKLFWQIVLLMVIGTLLLCALKCGVSICHKYEPFGKCGKIPQMQGQMQGQMQRGEMMKQCPSMK